MYTKRLTGIAAFCIWLKISFGQKGCLVEKSCDLTTCEEILDQEGCKSCKCYWKSNTNEEAKREKQKRTGVWGAWSEFGPCSVSCDFGFKYRLRRCLDGVGQCDGSYYDFMTCADTTCSGVAAILTKYSSWSSCNATCGPGLKFRQRWCRGGVMGHDACRRGTPLVQKKACTISKPCPQEKCYDHQYPWRYRGAVSKGNNGGQCLTWKRSNGYTDSDFPEYDLVGRRCRNPNKTLDGPWCFQSNYRRKQPCKVAVCRASWSKWSSWTTCSMSCGGGMKYRTRKCNRGAVGMDKCDGNVIASKPCSTDACPIPQAPVTPAPTTAGVTTQGTTAPATTASPVDGIDCISNPRPVNYRGTISKTTKGLACQAWGSDWPHKHNYKTWSYPNADLVSNYCRNPDNDKWAWCITTDPVTFWSYCDVPECPSDEGIEPSEVCYFPSSASSYRGTASTTQSGYPCQFWDANTPHAHSIHSYSFPGRGLGHHNYCRSPDSASALWCFSTNPNHVTENCVVEVCAGGRQCGNPDIPLAGRIVGGQTANEGSIPWQVHLRYIPTGVLICGASIMSERWIITAAHCVDYPERPDRYVAYVGSYRATVVDRYEATVPIELIINHPNYNSNSLDYDISLMKSKADIQFNTYVKPVCLPPYSDQHDYTVGEKVLVSGWGYTLTVYPDLLQQVFVPLMSYSDCQCYYPGSITSRMLCAGFPEGAKDSCQGDSGGPLVSLTNYELLGIVSWGIGCAQAGRPGVYTNVAILRIWIDQQVANN